MSHFAVMVVHSGEEQAVETALAPYHEFECTGIDDEFVQDIDRTEEVLAEYAKCTERVVVLPDGEMVSVYDEQFYRELTEEEQEKLGPMLGTGWGQGLSWESRDWNDGKGYRAKIHDLSGCDVQEVPIRTPLVKWLTAYYGWKPLTHGEERDPETHKYGYALLDEAGNVSKCIDRTNPNKKWDWYQVGGRYAGWLRSKKHSSEVNCCKVANLDLVQMKASKELERINWIQELVFKSEMSREAIGAALREKTQTHETWLALPERPRGDEYKEWLQQQPCALYRQLREKVSEWDLPDIGMLSLNEWIRAVPALYTFAVVKDGTWYEKGKMGWWACVSNEDAEWDTTFQELLSSLNPESYITIVDCHI